MPASRETKLALQINEARRRGFGQYMTTEDSCLCPDHKYRHRVCKHMLAEREKAELRRMEEEDAAEDRRLVEEMRRLF